MEVDIDKMTLANNLAFPTKKDDVHTLRLSHAIPDYVSYRKSYTCALSDMHRNIHSRTVCTNNKKY